MMSGIFFLVDDDKDDRELFCEALAEVAPDIVFHAAEDGREALDKLSKMQSSLPDIIFLDANLPTISGWECLEYFKQNELLRDIPVIMYSTSSYQRDIEKAMTLGALCFISKPLNYNDLKKIIGVVARLLTEYAPETGRKMIREHFSGNSAD